MTRTGLLIAVAVAITLTGCSRPTTSTFHGTVKFRGKVLTSGAIYFLGPPPGMQMGMGTIHDDGTYTATDVPVGEVRVSFQAPGVPERFTDPNTSTLIYNITARMTELDITVPSEP